ncbi:hypothetical protein V1477_020724 [Vespula maculifrons]|uniref:Uncharacterized protein n=1 Tax=Vespula maculifrons TaxID=7453 RepID=A0ABD2AMQ5_VESMC
MTQDTCVLVSSMIIRLRIPSDEQIVSEQCTVLTSLTSKLLVAGSPSPRIAKNVSLMLPVRYARETTKIERHKADRDLQQNHMKPYCLQVLFSEKLLCTEQNCNYREHKKRQKVTQVNVTSPGKLLFPVKTPYSQRFITGAYEMTGGGAYEMTGGGTSKRAPPHKLLFPAGNRNSHEVARVNVLSPSKLLFPVGNRNSQEHMEGEEVARTDVLPPDKLLFPVKNFNSQFSFPSRYYSYTFLIKKLHFMRSHARTER